MRTDKETGHTPSVMALLANKLSMFVFAQATEGKVPYEQISYIPSKKLLPVLLAKTYQAYLIDLSVFELEPEEIADLLIRLKSARDVPIILFASGYNTDHPLVEHLRMQGFEQWVLSDELATMNTQLRACLAGAKNAIELAESERKKRRELEKNVAPGHRSIGFIGTSSGVGTTTQALQYTRHLQKQGHTACYIEAGNQRQMEKIPKLYSPKRLDNEKGYLEYKDTDIYFKPLLVTPNMRMAYDVCVYDYGTLARENISDFLSCTGRICVAGTKPWEYGLLRWALSLLEKEEVLYLLPLILKPQYAFWNKRMEGRPVMYPAIDPRMFEDIPANKQIYRSMDALISLAAKNKPKRRK